MRYVAFLRGINLGRRRVAMSTLRSLFLEAGLTDVATCVASGNVLFTDRSSDQVRLERKIERQLELRLGYEVETFVRTAEEIRKLAVARLFAPGDEAAAHAVYALFMRTRLPGATGRRLEACRTPFDQFRVIDREIFWLCRVPSTQSDVWKSQDVKALDLPVNTMRNMNTVRRIALMLDDD